MSARILIVGPLPPPPGGGETVTKVLVESSLNQRYEVRHFDITRRQSKEHMGRFTLANAVWGWRYLRGLRRELASFRPHLVHMPITSFRAPMLRDWLFARSIRGIGAHLVTHSHSSLFARRYRAAGPLWRRFTRHFLGMTDVLICLTPGWKEFFDGLGLGIRTEIVYNPIDPAFVEALDRAPDVSPPEEIRILFVGAICGPKGIPELLDALEVLLVRHPHLVARLVGGRQYPGHYERIVEHHRTMRDRERIVLTGPLFGDDLAREYRSADLFVLPSHHEAMPMVVTEAMQAGLPVVSTRVGGIPEIVEEGVHGELVEVGDVEALTRAIDRLVSDEGLRARIGACNREAAQRYSAETFVGACDRIYTSLLSAGVRAEQPVPRAG